MILEWYRTTWWYYCLSNDEHLWIHCKHWIYAYNVETKNIDHEFDANQFSIDIWKWRVSLITVKEAKKLCPVLLNIYQWEV